jgi:hypothetical protein
MRTTCQCTKCGGDHVWRIERLGVRDPQYTNGSNVPIGAVERRGFQSHGDRFPTLYEGGHVDAYVCAACGYTELYWKGFEALRHYPPDGVHLLVRQEGTPYR